MSYLLSRVRETWQRDGVRAVLSETSDYLEWQVKRSRLYGELLARDLELRNRCLDVDPVQLVSVDPAEIEYVVGELVEDDSDSYHFERPSVPSQGRAGLGAVRGGDWDQPRVPVTDLSEYRLFERHFLEGVPWSETEFVERHLESPTSTWSERKLLNKFQRFDELYRRIDSDGYRTQRELGGHPLDEIIVYMGREGELRWHENGRHRLIIAKLLELESVPVLITVRHRERLFPPES